jgi:hypothetical protein
MARDLQKKSSLSKKACGVPFIAPHGFVFPNRVSVTQLTVKWLIPVYPEQAYGNRRKP